MLRHLLVYVILLVLLMLVGCSSQPNPKENTEVDLEKEEVVNEEDNLGEEEVQLDESLIKEQEEALKTYFDNMIKAVEENDKETFLTYQDETNELFYSEQVTN